MSFPTIAQVPILSDPKKINDWAREITAYLSRHVQIFAWPEQRIVLANGDNNNIDLKGGSFVHIIGPTANFTITGVGRGSPGREVILHNFSGHQMTIAEESGSSQGPNRIHTFVGDVPTPIARLLWDHQSQRWIMTEAMPGSGGPGTLPVFEEPIPPPDDVTTRFQFSTSWSSNRLALFRNGVLQRLVTAFPVRNQYVVLAKPFVDFGFPPLREDNLFGIYWPQ